ncbi:synaptopodin isoform 2-T2 [Aplochiton taeniatus]
MQTEREHMSVRRGVSWSPGGVRKPFQTRQDLDTIHRDISASWETGVKGQTVLPSSTDQMGRKTNLTRSASLSEKELKEARMRSHIIAAQLTIPSNSNSRGVQLFNRRRQRVNAFTLTSCGRSATGQEDNESATESGKRASSRNILAWEERSSEGEDTERNSRNIATRPTWSPSGRTRSAERDIMEDPGEPVYEEVGEVKEESAVQERHFLPVSDKEEEEEEEEMTVKVMEEEEGFKVEAQSQPVDEIKDEITPEMGDYNSTAQGVQFDPVQEEAGQNGAYTEPAPPVDLPNGCHRQAGPARVCVSLSKQPAAIVNRTARPFFSPPPEQPREAATSPVTDIPPAPSYSTPPLPTFNVPRPEAFSPPPPPPTYPTPPLPAFSSQPSQPYSSTSPTFPSPPPSASQFPPTALPASQQLTPVPPVPKIAPRTAPRPSTFIPKPTEDRSAVAPMKSGILEEGAARRTKRKSMFTFKEKPVVAPNPELLSLVQGADQRKKHGMPEPATEEELMALGAEASNFLAKEEVSAEAATAPEWSSCLKNSTTRARVEHKPEQTLSNVSGKGAELFAKRQSRMEKYVVENPNALHQRSPSPTMSLPPSWIYPSNMPGRVKAIAKNSEMSAQLTQTLIAQQSVQRKPVQKAPAPAPVPESPPLENGCSKIEMELSRHQPYQLSPSLFIFNPIKDPVSSLPRGAPPPKPLVPSQPYNRQTSLPISHPPHLTSQADFRPAQRMSSQLPLSPTGGMDYPPNYVAARASSQALSPDRMASPRSVVQAPRPTFSAKRAGIEAQTKKDSSVTPTPTQTSTPTRTPQFSRRFSSPEGPPTATDTGTWSPSLQTSQTSSTISAARPSVISPVSPPWGSRCQSPMISQINQPSSNLITRPSVISPVSPPWGSRCQSPMISQPSLTPSTISTTRPLHNSTFTATSPLSPPWGSRCQSPMVNQTSQPSSTTKPLHTSKTNSPVYSPRDTCCTSPNLNTLDSRANHRLLAKNIINAAKRKNSPSPGAVSGHSMPISPLGSLHHGYEYSKPPFSPLQPTRAMGTQSPQFTSPPPTPTQMIRSPVRLYNTRSLTDSDASVESEDSGLRSPGRSYNTCPRGWGGSLRVKRGSVSTDL